MKKIFLLVALFLCAGSVVFASNDVQTTVSIAERLQFFLILVPAALWDSINPCAFAVMFILLSSVMRQKQSRKQVLLSAAAFIGAVFISYIAIGFGLYHALASSDNVYYVKLFAGILGILVGLANLKDYFWYGKWFRMEVPISWRPNMKKLIKKVTSPVGAFAIWILISLFLLPCTSGPYITVLGYLSSDVTLDKLWGYIYIFSYNLIFIVPMVVIAFIVAFGHKDIGELKEYKELNVEKMHLITGIIMLLLGVYILYDIMDKIV